MTPDIPQELFMKYVRGAATAAESAQVQAWLAQPVNQLLAQHWMREHWDDLALAPTAVEAALEPDYELMLTRLHEQMGLDEETSREEIARVVPMWRRWAAAAAVAATVGAGGWLLYGPQDAKQLAVSTDYGQMRTVQLPDGSEVTLNGHSTLRYASRWQRDQPREVWLDGEGYFSVQHQPNHQRFLVHTRAGFNVEVLGTKFTVFRRRDQARVVLLSGKVRVDFDDQRKADLIMRPGELVETHDAPAPAGHGAVQPELLIHKEVKTAPYAAWKDSQLVLDETSIAELAARLQDTYGVEVQVASPELSQRKMTGTVPVRDLDVLLRALEETFHLKAERQPNRIVLSDNHSHNPSL